jgi:hypothetical protein
VRDRPIASTAIRIAAARPSERYLEDLRRKLPDFALSYREAGATAGPLPEGYRHDRVSTQLGRGADIWDKAKEALRTWQAVERLTR